ncbi:MAG: multiheme c-type cytochrome [Thermodesulfobacteriota bacterium]
MHPLKVWAISLAAFLALWFASIPVRAGEPTYVGYERCKDCHPRQYETWKRHAHSRAFASLRAGRQKDAKCVVCHSTGTEKGQILEDVQCEACHGPGSLYKGPTIMSKGMFRKDREAQRRLAAQAGLTPIEEAICLRCHGKERPPGHPPARPFEYPRALETVRH